MGLFLHAAVASVSPTESAADEEDQNPTKQMWESRFMWDSAGHRENLLRCEGVNNQTYFCESGHCCGESQCCSYYYELWWFWLVWAIIFILSCCCVCHHRRTKHRLQQQQRQHEINLIAYREAHNYPSVPFYFRFLPNYLLPDYEEVVNRPPTPPPPYTALLTGPSSVVSSPLNPEQQDGHGPTVQSSPGPPTSDSLCCRPTEEPPPASLDFTPKPEGKRAQTAEDADTILRGDGVERLSSHGVKGDSEEDCRDPLMKDIGLSEDKERLPNGRRRRFTGDSGIEVCVCGTRGSGVCGGAGGTGPECKELRELESLLGQDDGEEVDGSGDFCDSCSHGASLRGEDDPPPGAADRRAGRGPTGSPSPPGGGPLQEPVCLLLHTINEQEGGAPSSMEG
ncbi:WW domain binding protein 1-like [Oryzias melastigma]|uniref:WW domain binding protein 1-like n=1 Tax=Oryzias melastigma TaxID=30732 RepID=A0A834FRA4_ORYME|nr:WW domain binding protein 1-like [Oryzias melastigma]